MESNNSNMSKIWFRNLNGHQWITLCNKYGIKVGISLTDERIEELYSNEINQMYLAEHPQPLSTNTGTGELMKTHNLTMLAAMEFGYRECEKGNNLDMAFINFNKALNNK